MKRRTRINYTPEQKAIIWDRYKQGDSLHDIAIFHHAHNPPDRWLPSSRSKAASISAYA